MDDIIYDTAIIGGGLAGLSTAILLAGQGRKVLLIEKEQYPFHKVCGEYISMESWNFIKSLGLDLDAMELPKINELIVTAPGGKMLKQSLELGGFGISRYMLDNALKNIAVSKGITVMENCKVDEVIFEDPLFKIRAGKNIFSAKTCCGSFGKRSNLDIKWKRNFTIRDNNRLNNYIAVKYHIYAEFPSDSIALHNFEDGYCGISRIEGNKFCLCYLTTAANLKKSNNSVDLMEQEILSVNPHLRELFARSSKLYKSPLTISQISFEEKERIEQHILMLGDAAGLITPLCGNGMSMAMHSGKIAAGVINQYLSGKASRAKMEENYKNEWTSNFATRLKAGRFIQKLFGGKFTTNIFISIMKAFPSLTRALIRSTHGKPF